MKTDITFLTLRVFSATGGIEKVCRIAGKALYEDSITANSTVRILSSHDNDQDAFGNDYFPAEFFQGYGNKRLAFISSAVKQGVRSRIVLLSHVNLLPIGWLIQKLHPSVKLYLLAHGIEVWSLPLGFKKKLLPSCDKFLCVSSFTAKEMHKIHGIAEDKLTVLNNCIDPFLSSNISRSEAMQYRNRYGLLPEDRVMFTLTRMDASERYKGYDRVIEVMAKLKESCPHLKYLIGGSYQMEEKAFIDEKIATFGLKDRVFFTGFIKEEELPAHFAMCDSYVMPSYNEGFGIVFIEAMFYGLPVIAGNKDGSVDALANGQLGMLVDPMDLFALQQSIAYLYHNKSQVNIDLQLILQLFGYESYKEKLVQLLKG